MNTINTDDSTAKKEKIKFSINDVEQNSGAYRAYKTLIDKLDSVFIALNAGVEIDMRPVDDICVRLLYDLREYPGNFVGFILGGEVTGYELAKSSVNIAILSALIAQELSLPRHKVNNIVSAALLHDVGMLRLSKSITQKKGGLSDMEIEQVKSHPLYTSKIITKELSGTRELNLIAMQHHERWDGKGYPNHVPGSDIDIGARIISVADAFEAMVSKKPYRNSMAGYHAVKNLLVDSHRRFDPAIIQAFVRIMGVYPIGSIVRLGDGSVARVVSVNVSTPLRPVIQMLIDKDGNVLGPDMANTIDLLQERKLFIKEAVEPADFAGGNE